MATTEKLKYASAASLICTVASLAANAARQSTEIDNTTDLFVDVMLGLKFKLATGTPGDENVIKVWFFGNVDGVRDGNAGASDAAYTLESPSNLKGPFNIAVTAAGDAVAWEAIVPSVAFYFDGTLPTKWGVVVDNQTNLGFDSTESNHTKRYIGVHGQSA